jgi:putative CocE/NonD family hydrolase
MPSRRPRYLGFTAWALASTRPPQLKALSVQLYSSDRTSSWFPGGSFHLEMALPWAITRAANADAEAARRAVVGGALAKGYLHLPLSDADRFAGGETVAQYQDWLRHPGPGPHWDPIDFSAVSGIPTLLIDGWYDYHMPYLVQDCQRLIASGTPVRLVLGPWEHLTMDNDLSDRETLAWLDEHLRGRPGEAPRVRYCIQPSAGWRDATRWPPEPTPATFHLGTGGRLTENADDDGPDLFVYDPADPTLALGGAAIAPPPVSGGRDQAERESRPDVLVYSTDPLPDDVLVIGSPTAEIHLQSSAVSTDVFVRLCDVGADGTSWNVTDGFLRLRPDGVVTVAVELAPTAYRFAAGHRIRLQVSSGAHPVYARNPGTGEALADATTLVAATQQILHRSTIMLPVAAG